MSVRYDMTAVALRAAGYRPIHAGDDYDHGFTAERPAGSAVDLTGATVWLTVKDGSLPSDSDAKLQLISTDAAQIEITGPTAGQFTIKLRGTGSKSTADLEGKWDYDIQIKLSAGTLITWASGKIEFLPNLTRATS